MKRWNNAIFQMERAAQLYNVNLVEQSNQRATEKSYLRSLGHLDFYFSILICKQTTISNTHPVAPVPPFIEYESAILHPVIKNNLEIVQLLWSHRVRNLQGST
ncbi:hypothetical protein NPIL_656181 [Nephila pilipes]|uniref:Uncharacterized protein n=1 Tax=Nephila pilipes TaxID=299642 RepID=A0A8X6NBF7_NEPPI|nr:hypothetical protein NPIL_656181 [Nephila pilipes]